MGTSRTHIDCSMGGYGTRTGLRRSIYRAGMWSASSHPSFYVAGLTGECRRLLTQVHCGLDDHKNLRAPEASNANVHRGVLDPFLSRKLQFTGQLGCPENSKFWDTGISGTCLRDVHDPTGFRDTPMGLSILHRAARE